MSSPFFVASSDIGGYIMEYKNSVVSAIESAVDMAWNPRMAGRSVFINRKGDKYIVTLNKALNHSVLVLKLDGGIQNVNLSNIHLEKFCAMYLSQTMTSYLVRILLVNHVIDRNKPIDQVMITLDVEAFIAALFPNALTEFYEKVVKTKIIEELKAQVLEGEKIYAGNR